MLLQRLELRSYKPNELVCDYMGAAEYEFGAAGKGRQALARSYLDGRLKAKRTRFIEDDWSRRPSIDVVVMGDADTIDAIGEELIVRVTHERFQTENKEIVAWMRVGHDNVEPMLIVRANLANAKKLVEQLLASAIEYERRERVSQKQYEGKMEPVC